MPIEVKHRPPPSALAQAAIETGYLQGDVKRQQEQFDRAVQRAQLVQRQQQMAMQYGIAQQQMGQRERQMQLGAISDLRRQYGQREMAQAQIESRERMQAGAEAQDFIQGIQEAINKGDMKLTDKAEQSLRKTNNDEAAWDTRYADDEITRPEWQDGRGQYRRRREMIYRGAIQNENKPPVMTIDDEHQGLGAGSMVNSKVFGTGQIVRDSEGGVEFKPIDPTKLPEYLRQELQQEKAKIKATTKEKAIDQERQTELHGFKREQNVWATQDQDRQNYQSEWDGVQKQRERIETAHAKRVDTRQTRVDKRVELLEAIELARIREVAAVENRELNKDEQKELPSSIDPGEFDKILAKAEAVYPMPVREPLPDYPKKEDFESSVKDEGSQDIFGRPLQPGPQGQRATAATYPPGTVFTTPDGKTYRAEGNGKFSEQTPDGSWVPAEVIE